MKKLLLLLLAASHAALPGATGTSPAAPSPVLLSVHGAWAGGWQMNILTVDPGKRPEEDTFHLSAERARARGWSVSVMAADHVPQWRQPEATAELLLHLP